MPISAKLHPSSRQPRIQRRKPAVASSPLMLCDHLISLAQEADRAGYPGTAGHLVALLDQMFEERRPTA